ncbi:uncharacterized protein P884DRAFT_258593 [Thermothelomyces heterothallicus CBS 202.75]|uniref:uncharacterized protein n=1 Tax=Thermothelomyces heterothallicus CBS 202.75 TaxID=1149848 RepID=UPI003742AB27
MAPSICYISLPQCISLFFFLSYSSALAVELSRKSWHYDHPVHDQFMRMSQPKSDQHRSRLDLGLVSTPERVSLRQRQ